MPPVSVMTLGLSSSCGTDSVAPRPVILLPPIEPAPCVLEGRPFTTGPPGQSLVVVFF